MAEFGGAMYTCRHNLQGDIIGIVDNTGKLVVRYGYDAWGKPTEVWSEDDEMLAASLITAYATLAALNPFRYRGYVWDDETGLYYLKSRYYASAWLRFINSDSVIGEMSLIRHNIFPYCSNNPVAYIDITGYSFEDYFDALLWGWLKFTNIVMEKSKVYFAAKSYNVAQPSKNKGPALTAAPKTIARGTAVHRERDDAQWLRNFATTPFDEYYRMADNTVILTKLTVNIQQKGEADPEAYLYISYGREQTTRIGDTGVIQEEVYYASYQIIERTDEGFHLYSREDGKTYLAKDEDGVIAGLIATIELEVVE